MDRDKVFFKIKEKESVDTLMKFLNFKKPDYYKIEITDEGVKIWVIN